jgi:predicted nucleic acid-binding protein
LPSPTDPTPAELVLDTNVVLDWLVFRNPSSATLSGALSSGCAIWLATASMHRELEHVLTRGSLDAWSPDLGLVRSAWERWGRMVEEPPSRQHGGLRCTDADDQVFLDLALHHRAAGLLSRDRALLRLAGAARRLGLQIVTPDDWARSFGGEGA